MKNYKKYNIKVDKREIYNIGTCYKNDAQIINELDYIDKELALVEQERQMINQTKKTSYDLKQAYKIDRFIELQEQQKKKLLNCTVDKEILTNYHNIIRSTLNLPNCGLVETTYQGDLQIDYCLQDDVGDLFYIETKNSYYSLVSLLNDPSTVIKWLNTYRFSTAREIRYSIILFFPLRTDELQFFNKFPKSEGIFKEVIKLKNYLNKKHFDKQPVIKIKRIEDFISDPKEINYQFRISAQMKYIADLIDMIILRNEAVNYYKKTV